MPETGGFLLVDKAPGSSSFDVIRDLRRLTGIRRIGHTGTLDPFATGLLICALGNRTRLCQFLEAEDKSYDAVLKLGEKTSTGDTEGEVVASSADIPGHIDQEELARAVLELRELPTPIYSAVKVQGKPAYAYARQGIALDLPQRPVRISTFQITSYEPPCLSYTCLVSKGTYIRSLGEFIAARLGTVGHTVSLRRTSIGAVSLADSSRLEDLTPENYASRCHDERRLFANYPGLVPEAGVLKALYNGQAVADTGEDASRIILFDAEGRVLGVAQRSGGLLHPVINLGRDA